MLSKLRLGQISLLSFIFRLFSAAIGFVATIYIARILGPEPLGIYHLSLAFVSWIAVLGKVGLSGAISKRISEGKEQGQFASAGGAIIGVMFLILSIVLYIFQSYINNYIGFDATKYVVFLLFVYLFQAFINPLLVGLKLVHIKDLISTIRVFLRSGIQITLVFLGLSTVGLFIGHIVAFLIAIMVGAYVVSRNLGTIKRPKKRHMISIGNFAKFSWLGNLRGPMLNYTDILVLGFFVSQSLVGVYAIAWNISQFLIIFSTSVRSALFPEISELSSKQKTDQIANLLNKSIIYGGIFVIPAVFGGAMLGEKILKIYGSDFVKGSSVLVILIIANLFRSYQIQFLNLFNGIDRPDLSFRINAGFVILNIILNVLLVYIYGWIGAAVATATSMAISLALSFGYANQIIEYDFPLLEVAKQWFAALIMTAIVYSTILLDDMYNIFNHNILSVVLLVSIGAGLYFTTLIALSAEFRKTIRRNLSLSN